MPKINQYLIVKAQTESFKKFGFKIEFDIQPFYAYFAPRIRLYTDTKEYRFSESNWDIVSSQLTKLYGVLKHEKRITQYF